MLEKPEADPTVTADVVVIGSRRLQGLALLLTVVVVLADLGVPWLNPRAALQGALLIVGFSLARAVHTSATAGSWRVPLVIGMIGRVAPTVLITVGLTELYRSLADTDTGANAMSYRYLYPVAVVGAIGIVAPWVLTIGQRRLGRLRRSVVLLTVAGAAAVGGLFVSEALIEVSAVLVGVALGTVPLAALHRHPPTRLVWPALLALVALVGAPASDLTLVELGLRPALMAFAVAVITGSDIVGSLPDLVARPLASTPVHRVAGRSFGLYLWHVPFQFGLAGAALGVWAGWPEFLAVAVLSLAAATTTYRRIELPAQAAVRRLAGRWFDEDAVVPPALKAEDKKMVRWDDLPLDRLPHLPLNYRPTRLRRPTRLGAFRDEIDLRDQSDSWQPGERPPLPERPRRRSERARRDDDQAAAS